MRYGGPLNLSSQGLCVARGSLSTTQGAGAGDGLCCRIEDINIYIGIMPPVVSFQGHAHVGHN